MITPPLISSAESNGDIYYSTFLRFVKRLSEDFSKILRPGLPTTSLLRAMPVSDFEENTGLLQNRYLIIYTQKSTLSSQILNKQQKKRVYAATGAGSHGYSHIIFISPIQPCIHLKTDYGTFFKQAEMRARLRVARYIYRSNNPDNRQRRRLLVTTFFCKESAEDVNNSQKRI